MNALSRQKPIISLESLAILANVSCMTQGFSISHLFANRFFVRITIEQRPSVGLETLT